MGVGWGSRWLVKSGQFASQASQVRGSSRLVQQNSPAGGQTGDTSGCHCQCNRGWWAEREERGKGARSKVTLTGRQAEIVRTDSRKGRYEGAAGLPRSLEDPVNLPG